MFNRERAIIVERIRIELLARMDLVKQNHWENMYVASVSLGRHVECFLYFQSQRIYIIIRSGRDYYKNQR